jgi:O-antigen biosynthesis protein
MGCRRARAPRLIEWTGERCVPWAPDVQVVYEHFHRYLWARSLVADRRVLDLGSGEGFGAALLAGSARSVTGIDIDYDAVEHSRLNYTGDNLDFRQASASDLHEFADGSFDVVVAFEMIEHVGEREQRRLLDEVARVLSNGGLFIVSTPERRTYSDAAGKRIHSTYASWNSRSSSPSLRGASPRSPCSRSARPPGPGSNAWVPGRSAATLR